MNKIDAVGMAWYSRETYEQCRTISDDGDEMPGTYMEWLMGAKETEQRFASRGQRIVRAHIDPLTFPDWCRSNDLKVNGHARSMFASQRAAEVLMNEKQDEG